MTELEQIKQKLKENNQEQLIEELKKMSKEDQEKIIKQIEQINFDEVNNLYNLTKQDHTKCSNASNIKVSNLYNPFF